MFDILTFWFNLWTLFYKSRAAWAQLQPSFYFLSNTHRRIAENRNCINIIFILFFWLLQLLMSMFLKPKWIFLLFYIYGYKIKIILIIIYIFFFYYYNCWCRCSKHLNNILCSIFMDVKSIWAPLLVVVKNNSMEVAGNHCNKMALFQSQWQLWSFIKWAGSLDNRKCVYMMIWVVPSLSYVQHDDGMDRLVPYLC